MGAWACSHFMSSFARPAETSSFAVPYIIHARYVPRRFPMFPRLLAIPALATAALLGCTDDHTGPHGDPKAREQLVSLSTAESDALAADNAFGFKLFAGRAAAEQGNLFVSPLSVSMALT